MSNNWYALLAAIINPELSVDKALIKMGISQIKTAHAKSHKYNKFDPEDVEGMIRLKERGKTYKEIGELYGLTDQAVYRQIKRYKAKEKPMIA